MTVNELLNTIDCHELSEWMAYDRIEPFGVQRSDIQAGIIASTIANANRGKGTQPFKVSDFIPNFGPIKKQSVEEMKKVMQGIASAFKKKKGK